MLMNLKQRKDKNWLQRVHSHFKQIWLPDDTAGGGRIVPLFIGYKPLGQEGN